MKTTRFLFLAAVLLSAVLILAACAGATPPEDTTDATTTTAATTTATTTAATTTAATTTAPPTASQNPIKEAKLMSSGIIRLTYENGDKQFLGTADVREGYNSVSFTHSLDATTGILTLTLTDSTARNVAGDILSLGKAVKTYRLREAGGNLEWTDALSDNWQVLCPHKFSKGDSVLTRLCEATGFGKHTEDSLGSGVVLVIKGGDLGEIRLRARGWKDGTDFVTDCYLFGNGNGNFDFDMLAEINAGAPTDSFSKGSDVSYTIFKHANDDVAPINMNGTYIAAGHAYNLVSVIPNTLGLTLEDIGRVFVRRSDGQQYMLLKIDGFDMTTMSGGSLWFCPFDSTSMSTGNFAKYTYVATKATSLKGGNTIYRKDDPDEYYDIAADATEGQIRSSINHLVQHCYLNGTTEIDLTEVGVYEAEFIDIYEEYDVLYLPAVLNYLAANAGMNDNNSLNSDDITDYYFSHRNTFRFHKNGSCVIYSTYDFKKTITLSLIGGSQSIAFSSTPHYIYVPGSKDYNVPTVQPPVQVDIEKTDLVNPDVLASSYFQFSDAVGTKGMNLGFNPFYGTGQNDIRDSYLGTVDNSYNGRSQLLFYFTSYKMYPKLISHCTLTDDDFISCIAYRAPSYIMDEDFFAINWYWVGDDIYLSLHTEKALDKTVTCLPDYMNGMAVEVYENAEGVSVSTSVIENGSLAITTEGPGYVFIKLTPAN